MGLLAAGAAVAVVMGHDGRRAAQVAMLVLPLLLWLRWPVASTGWRRVRAVAVFALLAAFLLDGAVRAYLVKLYQATPDSSLVLSAAANTTAREIREYLSSQLSTMALAIGVAIVALALTGVAIAAATRDQAPLSRPGRIAVIALLVVCSIGYLSKPWRRHHPLTFWPTWAEQVKDLRLAWSDQQGQRDQLMRNARAASPTIAAAGPATVVLVLTDSVNRDNMSLYGYARQTTPQLAALSGEEAGRLLTLRHAWSVEAATLASLSGLFSFGERDADDPAGRAQHLLALARTAGYKIWWMSNHDDVAVDQQHARLADEVEMINRQPGRSTASLDGELLDCLEEALVDPTPRKLIVVHLLGAHPHYRLRRPPGDHPFDDAPDAVDARMIRDGHPVWLRESRQDYDAALRYHDDVVAQTLRLTRRHVPDAGQGAWMFLSDHGQEVGHDIVHAGHSPGTAAGYRIPALLWRNAPGFDASLASRPFRADWAGWTLAELMHLRWTGMAADRNVLDPTYAWRPPTLPARVSRFDR
ncbi:sulfatase [Roseateles aquatilis]|uniref:Sulfatase n=2 Tax=Roseateles aquatilis TaxID=431061 RepID=A0A246JMQ0_9BURK|nr:sulfatase [Roseateles aquatilis]